VSLFNSWLNVLFVTAVVTHNSEALNAF